MMPLEEWLEKTMSRAIREAVCKQMMAKQQSKHVNGINITDGELHYIPGHQDNLGI